MVPGTLVRLQRQPVQRQVEVGALAITVDGPNTFPELYQRLRVQVKEDVDEFIWVEWIKTDKRWHGQSDGAYAAVRFKEVVKRVFNSGKALIN